MSWIQDLAGRAENILNKIDKNAAAVLNEPDKDNPEQIESAIIIDRNDLTSSLDSMEDHGTFAEIDDSVESDMVLKSSFPSSKSISSQDSFILEDIQQFNEKISTLEEDNQELNKQLLNYQHLCSQMHQENSKLQSELASANMIASSARKDMEQYKARAQRIFQEKEELFHKRHEGEEAPSHQDVISYNSELKKELEFQHNKNNELEEQLSRVTNANNQLHQQIMLIQNQLHATTQELQEKIHKETKLRAIVEEECHMKSRELQEKLVEIVHCKEVIGAKEQEIVRLQEHLRPKPESDYEGRMKSLTDALILKQSCLESVTTEKNALRLQLEKLENECHNNLVQLQRTQVRIHVNDTDDDKSQVPRFMRISALDEGVTRRVKHAYTTLDSISIKAGVILRRYPVARVFLFCYIILLHVWVFIILFLDAPT